LLAHITGLVTLDAEPFYGTFLVGESEFTFAAALHLESLTSFTQFNQTNSTNSLFFRYVFSIIIIVI
jgi:hypothetical protein